MAATRELALRQMEEGKQRRNQPPQKSKSPENLTAAEFFAWLIHAVHASRAHYAQQHQFNPTKYKEKLTLEEWENMILADVKMRLHAQMRNRA